MYLTIKSLIWHQKISPVFLFYYILVLEKGGHSLYYMLVSLKTQNDRFMKKQKRTSIKSIFIISLSLLLIIAAVVVISLMDSSKPSYAETDQTPQVAKGRGYITRMEAVPTAPIEEAILAEEKAKLDEQMLQELLSDPDKIFSAIRDNNIVLVGESRTSGFSAYGYLDENHVLGGIGWSIMEVPALFDQIAALSPSYVIFCFGINEMPREIGMPVYFPTPDVFMEELNNSIETIKELVPDVKIYMNCIVPCSEEGYRQAPGFTVIPEWNEYIRNYCEQKGYGFIDISDLCAEHVDMYREDGTHLVSEFYPYWGARILEVIMRDE